MTDLVLTGRYVRFEPLEHGHVDGLVSTTVGGFSPLSVEPFPQGKVEADSYVDTALNWRDAGSAVPFAIIRIGDGDCDRFHALLEPGAMGVADEPLAASAQCS